MLFTRQDISIISPHMRGGKSLFDDRLSLFAYIGARPVNTKYALMSKIIFY